MIILVVQAVRVCGIILVEARSIFVERTHNACTRCHHGRLSVVGIEPGAIGRKSAARTFFLFGFLVGHVGGEASHCNGRGDGSTTFADDVEIVGLDALELGVSYGSYKACIVGLFCVNPSVERSIRSVGGFSGDFYAQNDFRVTASQIF